ncbi:hypothetical protein NET54_002294 [Listeria monocytogenes]|uniref:hypothetical protein n=1 Tax=Listeria monocytogenes TaxID=1639 RepID=UPI000A6A42C0|nr:hypothetical protein [Listeria monocytogenes]EHM8738642.1 hypothetical protein [Listeria monocytogenes]EJF6941317.1 hypothetical protein [Listeria monocytogenes]EJG4735244.1 hypothetical protein [Listeria monocytogenes]EJG9573455.1 hypothetical protein [Listeria monocytogenes]EJI8590811.1 hypothetical protein [Listeria monocytogenes]
MIIIEEFKEYAINNKNENFFNEQILYKFPTPITNDVLGHLNKESLKQALEDIYNLPIK